MILYMRGARNHLVMLFLMSLLTGVVAAQMVSEDRLSEVNPTMMQYQGCWSGADRSLTHLLITRNTIQDTRSRKLFHYRELSRSSQTSNVELYLTDEVPSRRKFEIHFVSENEIMVGMPMFRDKCKTIAQFRR